MRKLMLIIGIFLPILLYSNSPICSGYHWESEVIGCDNGTWIASPEIVSVEESDFDGCLDVYIHYDNENFPIKFVGLVRVEGDKIYCCPEQCNSFEQPIDSLKWYLMYDFGLNEGEGTFIYSAYPTSKGNEPYRTFIKCVGIDKNPAYPLNPIIRLEEYRDEICEDLIGTGFWICGLSSNCGFLGNNRFRLDGMSTILKKIADENDNIVYINEESKVSKFCEPTDVKVSINGDIVIVDCTSDIDIKLCTLSGMLVMSCQSGSKGDIFCLPSQGSYIIKAGNYSKKILNM